MGTLRVTYIGGSSPGRAADGRTAQSDAFCGGTTLARFQSHTLAPGTPDSHEDNVLPAGTLSVDHAICGTYGSAGTQHMRYEYSANGAFTDTVLLNDLTVNYPLNTCAHVCLQIPTASTIPCPYGSQPRDLTQLAIDVLPNLISTWAGAAGKAWLAARLVALHYTSLDVQDLCSKPPPVPGPVAFDDFGGNLVEMGKALAAIAWPALCECTPGTPSPAPYPPWVQADPGGRSPPPVFVYTTPGDPAALNEILKRLSEIQATVGYDLAADTLEQRWRLPFGTQPGPVAAQLVDEGQLDVSRALGLLITVTQLPPGVATLPGNPDYIKDLGWIAVDDGGAMLQELRITRQQQQWFPKEMQLATRVSWSLTAGTVIAIQQLLPEA